MTLEELYRVIDGDYERAKSVLRVDKLIDKHIRKLTRNGLVESLLMAGDSMEPGALFEAAHAVKGNCANLGLIKLSEAASQIAEEYRSGNPRKLTDDQVKEKLAEISALYQKAAEGIRQYEED